MWLAIGAEFGRRSSTATKRTLNFFDGGAWQRGAGAPRAHEERKSKQQGRTLIHGGGTTDPSFSSRFAGVPGFTVAIARAFPPNGFASVAFQASHTVCSSFILSGIVAEGPCPRECRCEVVELCGCHGLVLAGLGVGVAVVATSLKSPTRIAICSPKRQ